ncbi:hypothetical protein BMR1_01G00955 [Babesia microti strain RI]|uniref:Uncharacterized protein n=1 Tax=Babesia microti (strain RI) TaxID=1133968 RepID=I7I7U5_BABMR|nr:hypothetical protein BMR1_01G00955 [Babesia microti strain RI]CCF72653.1 hypothetical protein BMR1_01G00955 [Babesia microti strain RI]|eukprot:XP_012647262.1 hypothetical protein BMR1_01G00955 [Babesia microti strain RI]
MGLQFLCGNISLVTTDRKSISKKLKAHKTTHSRRMMFVNYSIILDNLYLPLLIVPIHCLYNRDYIYLHFYYMMKPSTPEDNVTLNIVVNTFKSANAANFTNNLIL